MVRKPARVVMGQVPYELTPRTGVIWKVTRAGMAGTSARPVAVELDDDA